MNKWIVLAIMFLIAIVYNLILSLFVRYAGLFKTEFSQDVWQFTMGYAGIIMMGIGMIPD